MTPETAPNPAALPEPPLTGLFTFVFTDIEGSSKMTRRFEDLHGHGKYEELRDQQRDVLLRHVHANRDWEASRAGDGHFFVFADAEAAFKAVVAFQQEVGTKPIEAQLGDKSDNLVKVLVRVGIHTCRRKRNAEKTVSNGREIVEFPGGDTNFAARVGGIGAGGQVLVSESFVRELWGDAFVKPFTHIAMNERPAPNAPLPILGVRCWPARALKSFEDEPSNHVYELLYDAETKSKKREPGSRFFPEFYVGEANRYIGRPDEENRVYEALGFGVKNAAPTDGFHQSDTGALAIVQSEGGMGKTRLAVTCAVRAAGEFLDGVYLVPLSLPQNDAERGGGNAEFVVGRLFAALPEHRQKEWGLARGANGELPPLPVVVDVLKNRRVLLVLDNFESLVPEVADAFLQSLFPSELHVLLTTRIDPDVTSLGQTILLQDGMDEQAALELAITRLRQKKGANWNPTPDDETHLREIIRLTGFPLTTQTAAQHGEPPRYGAIPLAVELAVGSLGARAHLSEVVAGLRASPLGIYSAASANWDDEREYKRHHSVTHTLDWSYGLLGENAKRVFTASGLFATSFEADALLKTASAHASLLPILVGNSLIRMTGNGRYILHSISRAYARVCLLGGSVVPHIDRREGAQTEDRPRRADAQEICQRFVDWYSAFVQVRRDDNGDPKMDEPEARAVFEMERENFIAASKILCEAGILSPASASCAMNDFGKYLGRIGALSEEEMWYRRYADFTRDSEEQREYGWATMQIGLVYFSRGFYEKAIQAHMECLAISRQLYTEQGKDSDQHKRDEAANLHGLANVYEKLELYDDAIAMYNQSGDIFRKIKDQNAEAISFHGLANTYDKLGKYDEAIAAYQKSLAIESKNSWGKAMTIGALGVVFYRQQRTIEAIDYSRDAAKRLLALGDPANAGLYLCNIAFIQASDGQREAAIATTHEAIAVYAKTQDEIGKQKAAQFLLDLQSAAT